MIVCHRHRFIFLKTRKTAGTSIEIALSHLCGPGDIVTPISPADETLRRKAGGTPPQGWAAPFGDYDLADWWRLALKGRRKPRFFNHIPATEARALVGAEIWDSYFKFCFERNPWDKVVSWYYHRYRKRPESLPPFAEFVHSGEATAVSDFDRYSINGRPAMDFMGRFETLHQSLEEVRSLIGLPPLPDLPRAKGSFRRDRNPLAEIYGPEERNIVSRAFSREIALLGYRFPDPR